MLNFTYMSFLNFKKDESIGTMGDCTTGSTKEMTTRYFDSPPPSPPPPSPPPPSPPLPPPPVLSLVATGPRRIPVDRPKSNNEQQHNWALAKASRQAERELATRCTNSKMNSVSQVFLSKMNSVSRFALTAKLLQASQLYPWDTILYIYGDTTLSDSHVCSSQQICCKFDSRQNRDIIGNS